MGSMLYQRYLQTTLPASFLCNTVHLLITAQSIFQTQKTTPSGLTVACTATMLHLLYKKQETKANAYIYEALTKPFNVMRLSLKFKLKLFLIQNC